MLSPGRLPAHPQVQQLAAALPGVLAGSVAPATFQRYSGPWRRFLLWCGGVQLPLPASGVPSPPMHVALHMVLLLQSAQSYSVVKAFSAAVTFFHRAGGAPTPCDSELVRAVRGAARRSLPSGEGKKAPLQFSHLQRIVAHCARPGAPLSDLWMAVWAVFGFFGFFRYSDLARVLVEFCFVTEAGVRVFLESRKNDQFREGSWVFMAANPGDLVCPVGLARRWLAESGLQPAEGQAMFPLVVGGGGQWAEPCPLQWCEGPLQVHPVPPGHPPWCIRYPLLTQWGGHSGSQQWHSGQAVEGTWWLAIREVCLGLCADSCISQVGCDICHAAGCQ